MVRKDKSKKKKPHMQYRKYICRTDPITGVFECYYGAAGGSMMMSGHGGMPYPHPKPPPTHLCHLATQSLHPG